MNKIQKIDIKLLVVIAFIVTAVLSTTYALLNFSIEQSTVATQAGCVDVDYTGTVLTTSSLVSTTDYTEGAHATVTLNKNEACEVYTRAAIHLHVDETNTAPLNGVKALKYKVMLGNNELSSGVVKDTSTSDSIPTDFTIDLTTVTLTTTATTYDVYVWIDSSVSLGTYNDTIFSGYIYASSEQTSTIKENYTIKYDFDVDLPKGYKLLPYIESTGTQYIDTGVAWDTNNLTIEGKYSYTDLLGYSSIFGAQGEKGDLILREESGNLTWWPSTGSIQLGNIAVGQMIDFTLITTSEGVYLYNISLNNGTPNIGGGTVAPRYDADGNIYLFDTSFTVTGGTGSSAEPRIAAKAKLYGLKIIKNGTLVRDFIPSENPSGVIGLYDVVTNTFYTNAGTGTFTKGETYTTTYTTNDTISIPNPSRMGYTFNGWTGSNGTTPQKNITIAKGSAEDKNYTANWTADPYTITYNFNQGLPSGYKQLSYIESTGTQYIDTGYSAPNGFIAEIEFEYMEISGGYITGSHNLNEPYGRNGVGPNSVGYWELGTGDTFPNANLSPTINTKYIIKSSTIKGKSYLDVNGTRIINTTDSTSRSSNNIWIFQNQYAQYHTMPTLKGKLYSLNIYNENQVLVRAFIPCENASGVAGLYDLVEGKFYGNNGSGSLTKGNVVSTQNYTITTTYTINDTFMLPNPSRAGYIFKGWTGSNGTASKKNITITKGSSGNKYYIANWINNN